MAFRKGNRVRKKKDLDFELPFAPSRFLDNHLVYESVLGSEKERSVVKFENRFSTKANLEIYEPAVKDVTKRLEIADEVKIGEDFKATASAKNESKEGRTVTGHLTAILVFYTGKAARTLKEAKSTVVLEPGEGNLVIRDFYQVIFSISTQVFK